MARQWVKNAKFNNHAAWKIAKHNVRDYVTQVERIQLIVILLMEFANALTRGLVYPIPCHNLIFM